jgi:hypothetical protein
MGDSFAAVPRLCRSEGCDQVVVFFIDAVSVQLRRRERSRSLCGWCGRVNILLEDGDQIIEGRESEVDEPPASSA